MKMAHTILTFVVGTVAKKITDLCILLLKRFLKGSPRVGPGASERPARVQSFSEGIFHISRECFVG
jgi:hypothetical protein